MTTHPRTPARTSGQTPKTPSAEAEHLASAMVKLPLPERFELVAQLLRGAANKTGKAALDMTEAALQLAATSVEQLAETQSLLRKAPTREPK